MSVNLTSTDYTGKAIGLPDEFLHSSGKGGGVIQGSASESIIVSMVAARNRAIRLHKLSSSNRLVAYCSKLVTAPPSLLQDTAMT